MTPHKHNKLPRRPRDILHQRGDTLHQSLDDTLHQSLDEAVTMKGKCAIIIIRTPHLRVLLPLVAFMQYLSERAVGRDPTCIFSHFLHESD